VGDETSKYRNSDAFPEATKEALDDECTVLRSSPINNVFIVAPYATSIKFHNPNYSPPPVIFFHIVIDPDDPAFLQVVEDQIEPLSTSFLVTSTATRKSLRNNAVVKPIAVYYNTIGLADNMDLDEFSFQCKLRSVFVCRQMTRFHYIGEEHSRLNSLDDDDDASNYFQQRNGRALLERDKWDAAITAVGFVTLERLYDFATTP
jgi:hypothetical protein